MRFPTDRPSDRPPAIRRSGRLRSRPAEGFLDLSASGRPIRWLREVRRAAGAGPGVLSPPSRFDGSISFGRARESHSYFLRFISSIRRSISRLSPSFLFALQHLLR